MRRILAGLLAAVFLAVNAASAFHRHPCVSHEDSCPACAVTSQARSAPSAAPAVSTLSTFVAVVVRADRSVQAETVLAVPARAPPRA